MTMYLCHNDDLNDLVIIPKENNPEDWDNYFELSEEMQKKLIKQVEFLK